MPSRLQWCISSQAISVSRRSMAIWVISSSCTQCIHPQSTAPSGSSSRSAGIGFGISNTSHVSTS